MSAPLFRDWQELALISIPNVKVPTGNFFFAAGGGGGKQFAQKILKNVIQCVIPKSFTGTFSCNSRLDVSEVKTESAKALSRYLGIKFSSLEVR